MRTNKMKHGNACLTTIGALLLTAAVVAGEVSPGGGGSRGPVNDSAGVEMNAELNLCNAPYFADPTGKRDSTEAILRALDDVTRDRKSVV